MANIYKVLGQSNPAATTSADLYTVGAGKSAVCSTITVCNQAATAATFRISVRVAGAATDAKQYIAYDTSIPANDVLTMTIGITLAATDVISVYASTATLSFNLFGSEIS